MLSRALSLATVMVLIGLATIQARAQNLEAGKTPSQIFSSTCAACHKSPRGLLRSVTPGSLPGFLRQHYTTSSDMASALSAYVVSNGAADARMGGGLTKQGRESMSEPKPGVVPPTDTQQARKPRRGAPDVAKPAEGEQPASIAAEPPRAKQKLGKKGRPGRDEPPKTDTAKDAGKDEPKGESAKSDGPKADSPKADSSRKDDTARPDAATSTEAKPEAPKPSGTAAESPAIRADPVPAVTPAPPAAESRPAGEPRPAGESKPALSVDPAPKPPADPPPAPAAPAASPSAPPDVAAPAAPPPAPAVPPPPVPAPVPPLAPPAPAGPPAPPISK